MLLLRMVQDMVDRVTGPSYKGIDPSSWNPSPVTRPSPATSGAECGAEAQQQYGVEQGAENPMAQCIST